MSPFLQLPQYVPPTLLQLALGHLLDFVNNAGLVLQAAEIDEADKERHAVFRIQASPQIGGEGVDASADGHGARIAFKRRKRIFVDLICMNQMPDPGQFVFVSIEKPLARNGVPSCGFQYGQSIGGKIAVGKEQAGDARRVMGLVRLNVLVSRLR